jgi:hypothetical protein
MVMEGTSKAILCPQFELLSPTISNVASILLGGLCSGCWRFARAGK